PRRSQPDHAAAGGHLAPRLARQRRAAARSRSGDRACARAHATTAEPLVACRSIEGWHGSAGAPRTFGAQARGARSRRAPAPPGSDERWGFGGPFRGPPFLTLAASARGALVAVGAIGRG